MDGINKEFHDFFTSIPPFLLVCEHYLQFNWIQRRKKIFRLWKEQQRDKGRINRGRGYKNISAIRADFIDNNSFQFMQSKETISFHWRLRRRIKPKNPFFFITIENPWMEKALTEKSLTKAAQGNLQFSSSSNSDFLWHNFGLSSGSPGKWKWLNPHTSSPSKMTAVDLWFWQMTCK